MVTRYTRGVYTSNKKLEGTPESPSLIPVVFQGDSIGALRGFPGGVRHDLGYALHRLQLGQMPPDRKVVRAVGAGVYELREQDEKAWYRILYIRRDNVIQVLHCFEKRSNSIEQKAC